MSYAENLLANGEQILYRARQHWLAPVGDSLRAFVIILVGLLLWFLVGSLPGPLQTPGFYAALIALLIGLVWVGIIFFTWHSEEYLVTNRRAIKVEGLIDKKAGDSALDKINDAILKQGLLARILKYGDLEILTANEDAIDNYEMVAHAVDFKKAMLNAKNTLEYGDGAAPARAVSAAPVAGSDISAKLDQLADLLAKGKITQADYDRKKADLLDKM